jgi:eukaryotic-like serine/threonine-protein kinase
MSPLPELLEPGAVLGGRYRIDRMAGSGGGSHVYVASDLKLPGKLWAVKQTWSESQHPNRMQEEAEMLIQLNHPRLPRIVDFFPSEEGEYLYLVMDYIEGVTLEQYVRSHRAINEEEVLRIAEQICDGLQYLHTREPPVIYRDLKPSNLMVEGNGSIRFIDFGTARTYNPMLTEDTVQLGTIGFAAPEQYLGHQSDARTDLYALGAIMLYLLSGGQYSQWPKEAKALLRRGLRPELVSLVKKLLAYEAGERFETAQQVKQELMTFKHGYVTGMAPEGSERPIVIAVAGASPGIGVTHICISLANSLAAYFPKAMVVEWNSRGAALAGLQSGLEASAQTGKRFEINQIAYHKKPSRSEWLQIVNSGYGLIVVDMGVDPDKDGLEEFARADLQIVVIPSAVWRRQEIANSMQRLSPYSGRQRVYVMPFADPSSLREMNKRMQGYTVYGVPAEPDPMHPAETTLQAIEKISEAVRPNRRKLANKRSSWWKLKIQG